MIVATHGRSIWILDDITPLQQQAEAMKTDAFLFDMRGGMQFNPANDRGFVDRQAVLRQEPDLRRGDQLLPVEAADQRGAAHSRCAPARRCARSPATICAMRAAPGINRVYWDLRHQPLAPLAGQPAGGGGGGGGGGGFGGGGNNGPNVMPGDYRVTLVVDGKDVATKTVRVTGDKDMPMTDAERKTWHDTALNLHEMQRVANAAAEAVDHARHAADRGGSAAEDRRRMRRRRRRARSPTPTPSSPICVAGSGSNQRRRWRWWRRLRRPAGQRARPARPGEGPDHGIDLDADGAAGAQQRRVARGPDQGDRATPTN